MSKILIIGGSGFLGSHVSDVLSSHGHKVYIFDKEKSKYIKSSQKMIIGDILDKELIDKAISKVDYVYHFAAIADIDEAKNDPIKAAEYNILATLNILESCVKHKIKRIIFSSSVYVYSSHGSFYKTTKQACELFISDYYKQFNLNFTILRYGSLYGRRANKFNFISQTIKEALIHGTINRKGDGSEIRDYINVTDAANLSAKILDKEYENQHIMITGNQTRKVKDLLDMINEIFDNKIKINYNKKQYSGHYQLTPYTFKPVVALKLTPKNYYDLGQGILDCIHYEYDKLVESNIKIKNRSISK